MAPPTRPPVADATQRTLNGILWATPVPGIPQRTRIAHRDLTVSAHVVPQIQLIAETTFIRLRSAANKEIPLRLLNLTGNPFDGVVFTANCSSAGNPVVFPVQSDNTRPQTAIRNGQLQEIWNASVIINSEQLIPGITHTCYLQATVQQDAESQTITKELNIVVEPEATVVPSNLFLSLKKEEFAQEKLIVRFSDQNTVPSADHLTIDHNLPARIAISDVRLTGSAMHVAIEVYSETPLAETVSGTLTLSFLESDLQPLSIPMVILATRK